MTHVAQLKFQTGELNRCNATACRPRSKSLLGYYDLLRQLTAQIKTNIHKITAGNDYEKATHRRLRTGIYFAKTRRYFT